MIIKGGKGTLLNDGEILTMIFSPDLTIYKYPLAFGSKYSDDYAYDFVAKKGNARNKHIAKVNYTVDGWGKVITPAGQYNCIRLKIVENKTDTIFVRFSTIFPWTVYKTGKDSSITYNWFAKETKMAVVELSFDSMKKPAKLIWSLIPPGPAGIQKNVLSTPGLSIHPIFNRPGSLVIYNSRLESINGELSLYNILGDLISRQRLIIEPGKEEYSALPHIAPGIYIYKFSSAQLVRPVVSRLIAE